MDPNQGAIARSALLRHPGRHSKSSISRIGGDREKAKAIPSSAAGIFRWYGLRGTGILARAEQSYEVDQIANDIGMSRQNVEYYMRFRDQMKVGADVQKRLRLVNSED